MHKAKRTPRQISLLPSVSRPKSIIRQLGKFGPNFRSCLMIDLGHETDGNSEFSRLAQPLQHQRTLFNRGDANSQ